MSSPTCCTWAMPSPLPPRGWRVCVCVRVSERASTGACVPFPALPLTRWMTSGNSPGAHGWEELGPVEGASCSLPLLAGHSPPPPFPPCPRLSGLSPFMGDNDTETLNNVLAADWYFDEETFEGISEEAKDFVSNLIIKEKRCCLPGEGGCRESSG